MSSGRDLARGRLPVRQICRTVVLGEASAERRADYALLGQAFAAGLRRSAPASAPARSGPSTAVDRSWQGVLPTAYMRVAATGWASRASLRAPSSAPRDAARSGMLFVLHPTSTCPAAGTCSAATRCWSVRTTPSCSATRHRRWPSWRMIETTLLPIIARGARSARRRCLTRSSASGSRRSRVDARAWPAVARVCGNRAEYGPVAT